MAPTYRTDPRARRANRAGYAEHDDFEGLPPRQWRQEWVNIAPPPTAEPTQKNDIWAVELPHGMPKDSQLLPTHTQELLRAARSGRLYKRPPPAEEEEAEADAVLPEKPEKKEEDPSTKGFQVKVWKQIPRNAEGTTVSHLAKRRKGIITLSSDIQASNTSGPTVTRATVRRIDAAGNPYTQEVVLHDGQPVDGEILSTTVVQAPSLGINAEGSASATPIRRRPPPPKRKAKGPGRGRKKKLPLPASTRSVVEGITADNMAGNIKMEGIETPQSKKMDSENEENKRQDSEMADDDEGEGDEGDEEGDEGDEGEEGDEEEGEVAETENYNDGDQSMDATPSAEQPDNSILDASGMDVSTGEMSPAPQQPSPLENTHPALMPSGTLSTPQYEGSPLKNVMIRSPTELSPRLSASLQAISDISQNQNAREVPPSEAAEQPEDEPENELKLELDLEPQPQLQPQSQPQSQPEPEPEPKPEPELKLDPLVPENEPRTHEVLETVVEAPTGSDAQMTDVAQEQIEDVPEITLDQIEGPPAELSVEEAVEKGQQERLVDIPSAVEAVQEPSPPRAVELPSAVIEEAVALEKPTDEPIQSSPKLSEESMTMAITEPQTIQNEPVSLAPEEQAQQVPEPTQEESAPINPEEPAPEAAFEDDEGPDLLGGLEAALDRQGDLKAAVSTEVATESSATVPASTVTEEDSVKPISDPELESRLALTARAELSEGNIDSPRPVHDAAVPKTEESPS